MSETAREEILSRMRTALQDNQSDVDMPAGPSSPIRSPAQRVELLMQNLESVRGEVHLVSHDEWAADMLEAVRYKSIRSLLYSETTTIAEPLDRALDDGGGDIERLRFNSDINVLKEDLFAVDAAVTTVKGAVAETGALILWPDVDEPRSMSLVPPVHIAVLKASTIFNTFSEAMEAHAWAAGMPGNAVMVSGPSKTADIELVLAFGVHGPKELVVFILTDC